MGGGGIPGASLVDDRTKGRHRPQIRKNMQQMSLVKSPWQDHDLLTLEERQIARRGSGVDLGLSPRRRYKDKVCRVRAKRLGWKSGVFRPL